MKTQIRCSRCRVYLSIVYVRKMISHINALIFSFYPSIIPAFECKSILNRKIDGDVDRSHKHSWNGITVVAHRIFQAIKIKNMTIIIIMSIPLYCLIRRTLLKGEKIKNHKIFKSNKFNLLHLNAHWNKIEW